MLLYGIYTTLDQCTKLKIDGSSNQNQLRDILKYNSFTRVV